MTELKSHEAVTVFVDLLLGQHPVPDMLLAENVGNLVDLGMEVQPFFRVVLHELAALCLLRQDKESPYLREFSSLKVAEVASCQKFRILRHLVVIGLFAEDILFLQGISLAKSLYDVGEYILKAQVLLCIRTELLHGIGHFKDYGRFAFCSEKNNMVVHLFQLGIEPVKCAFFVGSHRMSLLGFLSQVSVHEDASRPPFVMQSAPLLDKDGDQTRQCHHQHGDESGKLAQNNGEADKADKRHTDCPSSQCQETPSDAHKLQRLLQSLEYRIAFVIHRHTVYFFEWII